MCVFHKKEVNRVNRANKTFVERLYAVYLCYDSSQEGFDFQSNVSAIGVNPCALTVAGLQVKVGFNSTRVTASPIA